MGRNTRKGYFGQKFDTEILRFLERAIFPKLNFIWLEYSEF